MGSVIGHSAERVAAARTAERKAPFRAAGASQSVGCGRPDGPRSRRSQPFLRSAPSGFDNISFAIYPGEFTVLLGLNGAARVPFFPSSRASTRTEAVSSVSSHRCRRRSRHGTVRMGVVFQQSTLDLDLTVEQNLRYHAALHGASTRPRQDRIAAELDRVGLAERRRDKARS